MKQIPDHHDDDGATAFAKVTRDLTEQIKTEDALRASEEQFRLLVQSVTDYAIYMLSPEGIITNWNTGAERIKGYTPQEIIGQHFSKFYSPEDAAAGVPQVGLDTARREGRFEKEGWRYRKDGSKFWASVVIDAIRKPDGELIGYAKITRDMTERRQGSGTGRTRTRGDGSITKDGRHRPADGRSRPRLQQFADGRLG
jgi:PAS domain S-box-containing protein